VLGCCALPSSFGWPDPGIGDKRRPLLFNTVTYAYFFAAVFVVAWLLAPWRRLRLGFLLVSSYVFYAGWTFVGLDALRSAFPGWSGLLGSGSAPFWKEVFQSIKYVPLLFCATSIDFYLGVALGRLTDPKRRKLLLLGTVIVNVGILVFFKYWNWGADTFTWVMSALFGVEIGDIHLRVELPIGISFFCFMSLSYVIDVYRGTIPYCRSYLNYLTYISFFPHLVAGPIIRGRDLLPHLERNTHLTAETGGEGLFLIAAGLFKKVVIGDYIAVNFVDRVYAEPIRYSTVETLTAIYGYAVQVYCDFSGYSDVAIGSALLLGYRFKINFDAPYKSSNIVEFWRRWHISLSTWLRDYVYIALGGSRVGPIRKYVNILLTMVICGIWHGAAWTFVIFGGFQGVGVAGTHWYHELLEGERVRWKLAGAAAVSLAAWAATRYLALATGRPGLEVMMVILIGGAWLVGALVALAKWLAGRGYGRWIAHGATVLGVISTFTFISLTFVLFRAANMDLASAMFMRLVSLTTFTPNLHRNVLLIIVGALVLQWIPRSLYDRSREWFIRAPAPVQAVVLFGIALALREAASAEAVPFVYFQF